MKPISWENFDGPRFQRLCNSTLQLVVSKSAQVYSAPGPDGGIDQYYTGFFGGKTGKWRFQDKFKSVYKEAALAALRIDIRKDIETHLGREDYIVYITNINMTPDQEKELIAIAYATLREIGMTTVEVFVWHYATLETYVSNNPLLHNWYWESGAPVLEAYRNYFAPQLSNPDVRYQLHNPFIGRASAMKQLESVLFSKNHVLAIPANRLMGKTRLVLQFFQQVLDRDDEWIGLVLKPSGFSAASFSNLLSTARKMVILVDDAHLCNDQLLRDIKAEVDKLGGRVKCILTVRDTLYADMKMALPSYGRNVEELPLKRLTPAETKEMYRWLLHGMPEPNIGYLSSKSEGVPGVIIEYCNRVRMGGHPDGITEEQGFRDNITKSVTETIDLIEQKRDLPRFLIRQCIELAALISPAKIGDKELGIITSLLHTEVGTVESILLGLEEGGLVDNPYFLAIKPDAYGEVILLDMFNKSPRGLETLLSKPEIRIFIKQIITNLTLAGISTKNNSHFFKAIFASYLSPLLQETSSEQTILDIADTVNRLTAKQPELAELAIEQVLTATRQRSSPFSDKILSELSRVFKSLIFQATDDAHLAFYTQQLETFVRQTGMYGAIRMCYGFRQYDFESARYHPEQCCFRQLFFTERIKGYFTSVEEEQRKMALATFGSLFNSEYSLEEYYDSDTGAFSYGTGYVPDCAHTRVIRLRLLQGIIAFYRSGYASLQEKNIYLVRILGVLHFMAVIDRAKQQIDQSEEITCVLSFVHSLLDDSPTVELKSKIAGILRIGRLGEIKPAYQGQLDLIKKRVEATTASKEELALFLLTITYNSEDDKAKIQRLIGKYQSIDIFITDFKSIFRGHDLRGYTTLNSLLRYLGEHYLSEAKTLFTEIIETDPGYVAAFSCLSDYFYADEPYFFTVTERMWSRDEKDGYRSTVIAMLMTGTRRESRFLRGCDLAYIPWAIQSGELHSIGYLERNLYLYAGIAEEKTFDLLTDMVRQSRKLGISSLFHYLYQDEPFCARYKARIYDLIEQATTQISIFNQEFSAALAFIHRHFGLRSLFDFTAKTLLTLDESVGLNLIVRNRYQSPTGSYDQVCTDFFQWFAWVAAEAGAWDSRMTTNMCQFLLPAPSADSQAFELGVQEIIDQGDNPTTLRLLTVSLRGYLPYTLPMLFLQANLAEKYQVYEPEVTDYPFLFGLDFYENRETSKSGFMGQPYREDVRKRDVLLAFLQEDKWSPAIVRFIKEVLQTVQEAITDCEVPQ